MGFSATEIREVLVQVCIYMGVPAGMEAFKAAEAVLIAMQNEGIDGQAVGNRELVSRMTLTIDTLHVPRI